jgi:hypothetical protein
MKLKERYTMNEGELVTANTLQRNLLRPGTSDPCQHQTTSDEQKIISSDESVQHAEDMN